MSLTTKFLWLKIKQPILIYDAQARIALETKDGDLAGYYKKWQEKFKIKQYEIEDVCSKLPNMYLYAHSKDDVTKQYIKRISSEPWFHERVFDIYLWSGVNN